MQAVTIPYFVSGFLNLFLSNFSALIKLHTSLYRHRFFFISSQIIEHRTKLLLILFYIFTLRRSAHEAVQERLVGDTGLFKITNQYLAHHYLKFTGSKCVCDWSLVARHASRQASCSKPCQNEQASIEFIGDVQNIHVCVITNYRNILRKDLMGKSLE